MFYLRKVRCLKSIFALGFYNLASIYFQFKLLQESKNVVKNFVGLGLIFKFLLSFFFKACQTKHFDSKIRQTYSQKSWSMCQKWEKFLFETFEKVWNVSFCEILSTQLIPQHSRKNHRKKSGKKLQCIGLESRLRWCLW